MDIFSFRYKSNVLNFRTGLIKTCAFLQNKQAVFINSDPKLCASILQASNKKGSCIEKLLSQPAWAPLLSIESVDNKSWQTLLKIFKEIYNSVAWNTVLPKLITEEVNKLVTDKKKLIIDGEIISRVVIRVFYQAVFSLAMTESEEDLYYKASIEWRKEIAMKEKGDKKIKDKFIKHLAAVIKKKLVLGGSFVADIDINVISAVAQPFIISPQINISDIFAAMFLSIKSDLVHKKELISACNNFDLKRISFFLLETMRIAHPFPILERELTEHTKINGKFFKKGTQVFVVFDDFCHEKKFDISRWGEKNYFNKYNMLLFGAGQRICPGKNIAMIFMVNFLSSIVRQVDLNLIRPYENHLYSGRDNDHNDSLGMKLYQVNIAIKLLWKSMCIGLVKNINYVK